MSCQSSCCDAAVVRLQPVMLCDRPDPVLKAYVSDVRPFLPTSGTESMEGVGLPGILTSVRRVPCFQAAGSADPGPPQATFAKRQRSFPAGYSLELHHTRGARAISPFPGHGVHAVTLHMCIHHYRPETSKRRVEVSPIPSRQARVQTKHRSRKQDTTSYNRRHKRYVISLAEHVKKRQAGLDVRAALCACRAHAGCWGQLCM